jgi:lipopolysaccharide heptosyltransferase II
MSTPPTTWPRVDRVLAIRADNMGDVLMTTPALAAIRHASPQARITLLASPSGAALAPHLPMVDEVIAARVPWVKLPIDEDPSGQKDAALVDRLAAGRFDAAVIFTTATQSPLPAALMCRLAGIPRRLAHCRENPYALLSDWVSETDVVEDGMRHEVERQLALVAHVGWRGAERGLVFDVQQADTAFVQGLLAHCGVQAERPLVVVHPGATAASRRYPAARFGRAASVVHHAAGAQVVFTGDAAEARLIEEARAAMEAPSLSLAGQLSLGQLAALIDLADLLISNNTGPAHIAAARGTPVVDLYALTNPQHTPWQVAARVLNRDVPCRHCLKSTCPQGHHDCLLGVDALDVAEAALSLLSATRPDAPRLAVAASA